MCEAWRQNVLFRDTSQKHCMEQWNGSCGPPGIICWLWKEGRGREGITPVEKGVRCSNNTSMCSCLLLPVPENWWVSSIIVFWNVHFYNITFFLSYCDKDSFPPVSDWAHREDVQRPDLEAGTVLNLANQKKKKKIFVASRCSKSPFLLSLFFPKRFVLSLQWDKSSRFRSSFLPERWADGQCCFFGAAVAVCSTRIEDRWELGIPGIPIPSLCPSKGCRCLTCGLCSGYLGVSESLYTGYPHGSLLL